METSMKLKEVVDPIPAKKDEDSSPIFPSQHLIVKNILEKLPVRDLLSASQTCSIWADIGRVVRRQRKNRSWVMLYHPYENHTLEAFEFFNGYRRYAISDAATEFIQNAHLQGFPSYKQLVTDQCWPFLFPQMKGALQNGLLGSYFEPQMLVVVATIAVEEYTWHGLSSIRELENSWPRLKFLLGRIPEKIPTLATFCEGIVASLPNEPRSLEMQNSQFPLVSTLAIPKVPGLKIKMFNVRKELNWKPNKVNSENCKRILNISPEDNVKGIVLFHTVFKQPTLLQDAVFHYLRENPHVAFGGGVHSKHLSSMYKEGFLFGAGLIICGDENITVASVGLFDSKISKRNEDKLIEMKSCEMSGGDSFAFMFACCGSGIQMHRTPHVNSQFFRKHFPKTNVIGTFGKGVYCHEVIPTRNQLVPPPENSTNIHYEFATVFVLVSYKYPHRV